MGRNAAGAVWPSERRLTDNLFLIPDSPQGPTKPT
jgi:hypothetical protein